VHRTAPVVIASAGASGHVRQRSRAARDCSSDTDTEGRRRAAAPGRAARRRAGAPYAYIVRRCCSRRARARPMPMPVNRGHGGRRGSKRFEPARRGSAAARQLRSCHRGHLSSALRGRSLAGQDLQAMFRRFARTLGMWTPRPRSSRRARSLAASMPREAGSSSLAFSSGSLNELAVIGLLWWGPAVERPV
jgi:hypothetical protein